MSKVSAIIFICLIASIQPAQAVLPLIAAALAVAGVGFGPAAIGFTTAGITAGSTAAAMMSASAIASGGGVVAGGVVATLQSVGAAGVSYGTYMAAAGAGAAAGRYIEGEDE